MGDFNTRLYTNHIAGLGRHIGPALFSTSTEADLETNNLTHIIEFLIQHDLSIISSMRPRPPSKLVTYREIADLTHDPFHPNVDNFAVLDHILAPFQYRTLFRSIHSNPSIRPPWFHRHYVLTANFTCPDFVAKNKPAAPPQYLPPTNEQQLDFQVHLMEQFCTHSSAPYHAPTSEPIPGSLHIYTDGA